MRAPGRPRLQTVARGLTALFLVGCCAALALDASVPSARQPLDAQVEPIPEVAPACPVHGVDALAHARTLEQMAQARWERVPFALDEAPRAAVQMAEAEACYGSAQDRVGRLRAGDARAAYASEVVRRFARARLLLWVALREERVALAREQVATLLALLACAPPSARAYRGELDQLRRRYAAYAQESATREEGTL